MRKILVLLLLSLLAATASARGLKFAETMSGTAYYGGEFRNASVALNVTINDIDAWSNNLGTPAQVTGTLTMDRMAPQAVTGTLVILAPAPNDDGRLLTYKLNSPTIQFTGVKHVHDQAPTEVFDDMTTLHGLFQAAGSVPPTVNSLLYDATWSSELHFAWWDPVTVINFTASFQTINTAWWDVWEVESIFVCTMFGALASTLFPWLA